MTNFRFVLLENVLDCEDAGAAHSYSRAVAMLVVDIAGVIYGLIEFLIHTHDRVFLRDVEEYLVGQQDIHPHVAKHHSYRIS